jgi:hypothetical protein
MATVTRRPTVASEGLLFLAPWINVDKIIVSDNSYATSDIDSVDQRSNLLGASGFFGSLNGAITEEARIVGVQVSVEAKYNVIFPDQARILSVGLYYNNAQIGNLKGPQNLTTSDFLYLFGNAASDLWGALLTPIILNSPSFLVGIQCDNRTLSATAQAMIDNVMISVGYQIGGGVLRRNIRSWRGRPLFGT